MTETSARFALPFILPGQAQKELFHNESLARIDAALWPAVDEGPRGDPPEDPAPGALWIVAAGATGAWAGQDEALACWTEGGWRFVAPIDGMLVFDRSTGRWRARLGDVWLDGTLPASRIVIDGQKVVGSRCAAIADPDGGTVIDSEARAAIVAISATLRSHGLTD